MGEGTAKKFRDPTMIDAFSPTDARDDQWVVMDGDDDICDSLSITSSSPSSSEDSTASVASSSSSDLVEDASSSNSYSSSSSSSSSYSQLVSKGPLYELSELMAQLPIKRGLSKHFQGKSQSFTSLSNVRSIEDLAKREIPGKKKMMKPCKSYGGGLDTHKTISKKSSRGSFSSLLGKRGSFIGSPRPPIPLQKICDV